MNDMEVINARFFLFYCDHIAEEDYQFMNDSTAETFPLTILYSS